MRFFLAPRLQAHESEFSTLSSYEMLLLNAVPWPVQLADKFRCGVCSPLVGGIGFWARLLLLCRERSPLLWLWVWGGFELCTPLPPFLHPASQTPHTEQSWSGYRFGGVPSCRARGWKYSAWNRQMRNRSTSLMTSSIRTRGLNAGNPTVMARSRDYLSGVHQRDRLSLRKLTRASLLCPGCGVVGQTVHTALSSSVSNPGWLYLEFQIRYTSWRSDISITSQSACLYGQFSEQLTADEIRLGSHWTVFRVSAISFASPHMVRYLNDSYVLRLWTKLTYASRCLLSAHCACHPFQRPKLFHPK